MTEREVRMAHTEALFRDARSPAKQLAIVKKFNEVVARTVRRLNLERLRPSPAR